VDLPHRTSVDFEDTERLVRRLIAMLASPRSTIR
jgi:hypothetical protein